MTDDWLEVHRVWHELGGRSTATMMFGHVETIEERVEHLERVRQLQDETGGFTAFISWTFQPEHTDMADVPPAGAFEYLKTQAISRLYLDNVPNIQSSWVTQGPKIGQVALYFGANDMGSLMIEENVVSSAGTVYYLSLEQIRRAIREAATSRGSGMYSTSISTRSRPRRRNRCGSRRWPVERELVRAGVRARCRRDPGRASEQIASSTISAAGSRRSPTCPSSAIPGRSSACSGPTVPARPRPCGS